MKSNEEFIDGIYSKRNEFLRKRKKRNSIIATALCAVICVAAVAGFIGVQRPEKVEEFYNDIRKFGSFAKEEEFVNADRSEEESTTAFAEDNEYYPLIESYTKPTLPAPENEGEKIQQEGFVNKPEVLTDAWTAAIEGVIDGERGPAPEKPDSGGDSADPAASAPNNGVMYSTDKIIDAAHDALSEEDRQSFNKDKAVATVTRNADGTQVFEVTFTAADSLNVRHVKVQLDSDLNLIRILNF